MKFTEYGKKDGDTVILLHGASFYTEQDFPGGITRKRQSFLLTDSMLYYLFWMDMKAAIGLLLP